MRICSCSRDEKELWIDSSLPKFEVRTSSAVVMIGMLDAIYWRINPSVVSLLLITILCVGARADGKDNQCVWNDTSCSYDQDPHLKMIAIDLGNETSETFRAYCPPDVSTFYPEKSNGGSAIQPAPSYFKGQIAKFINLSPNPVRLYWTHRQEEVYIAEIDPFGATATAAYLYHRFVLIEDGSRLHQWRILNGQALYVYDPIGEGKFKLEDLQPDQIEAYKLQKNNLEFAKQYKKATGVEYLSLYPRRPPPMNSMWSADYFGQEHNVLSREIHFVELPPPENLGSVNPSTSDDVTLQSYRTKDAESLNMTLKVLSCSPRLFEIEDFLSNVEIDHLMEIATGTTLHQSATKAGQSADARHDSTRTSRNAWIQRGSSPIVDSIYRRAADLLQINQSYLLHGGGGIGDDKKYHHAPTAERLQLVHYGVGDQYMPHHDFAVPSTEHGQPMRFATILLYLNENMTGGETSFLRWLHADINHNKDATPVTSKLMVAPKSGKAVFFYSLLPDGNMDERSLHASEPITEGEKWLVNLWIWDPVTRHF